MTERHVDRKRYTHIKINMLTMDIMASKLVPDMFCNKTKYISLQNFETVMLFPHEIFLSTDSI